MANNEMIVLQIVIAGALWFAGTHLYNRYRKRRVLIVADDPDILLHEFDSDRVKYRRLNDVHAMRDIILYRPDAVIIDYNYQDCKAGRQLVTVCEINRIPALVVCDPCVEVCGVKPSQIVRKDGSAKIKINTWLMTKCA